jgi:NAD(P)-dependent dehydrogenase (short-subunit alcohol dehydrogenase family)
MDVARGFAQACDALGGLDLLVNNAGVEAPLQVVGMPLEELPLRGMTLYPSFVSR